MELQIELPPGWSIDPADLMYDHEWATDDSDGQLLCADYHLGKGRPVMWDRGACTLMFEAGGKFFLWSRIDQEVYEIVSPADLDGIILDIKRRGRKALKLKAL